VTLPVDIRPAREGDFLPVVNLYNQVILEGGCTGHLEPLSPSSRRDWFDGHLRSRRHPLLLACVGERIVGFAHLSPWWEGRDAFRDTTVLTIHIDRDHRRQGLGSRLLVSLIDLARSGGHLTAIAILFGGNQASIALLKRHGFETWGNLPEVVRIASGPQDHLILGRHLTPEPRS
jgi:L-amino acid N-acyltransferase YncA